MGRLIENPQPSVNAAPFAIQEGAFGAHYFVVPSEDVDLSTYVGQDVVVRGTLRPTSNPRHKVLVVERVFNRSRAGEGDPAAPREMEFMADRPLSPDDAMEEDSSADRPSGTPATAHRSRPSTRATGRDDTVVGSGLARQSDEERDDWDDVDVFGDGEPTEANPLRNGGYAQPAAFRSRAYQPPESSGPAEELPPPRRDAEPPGGRSLMADPLIPDELDVLEDHAPFDALHGPGFDCPQCGGPMLGGACGRGCGSPEWIWVRGEYLLWWTSGMDVPPLITTSPTGTPRAAAGVLGESGTSVLFGGDKLNDSSHSGFRVRTGKWLFAGKRLGIEGEYLRLDDQQEAFNDTSAGDPILARPVYDIVNGQETAELIAFPSVIRGTVDAEAITQFQAAGARVRWNICCTDLTCVPDVYPRMVDGYRIDWFAGYRYARLSDRISVTEDLTSLDAQNPGSFWIEDRFATGNEFHGGDVGFLYEHRAGRWLVDCVTRVAIGNNHQVASINGTTIITEDDDPLTYSGGILAQRSNIGFYSRDELSVIPEVGMTVGYQLTSHTRLTCGYSFIYFSNVVRAGDQIDRDLNTNLLPPEVDPFTGPLRPEFAWRTTDFWAQGLNLGVDVRF